MRDILVKIIATAVHHFATPAASLAYGARDAAIALLAAVPGDPAAIKQFADWGLYAALVWFLYYTTTVSIPRADRQRRAEDEAREARHRREMEERDGRHRREMEERDERFALLLNQQRVDFLGALESIRSANSRERRSVRKALGRVADMERLHGEAVLKLAQSVDVKRREDGTG